MLFGVASDDGREIIGYLVPDDAAEAGRLALMVAGVERWRGAPTAIVESLVKIGRHQSGLCGFHIGPAEAPGLEHETDVAVVELATGLTIYRRGVLNGRVARRVLRLETSLAPLAAVDAAMAPHFLVNHAAIHVHGRETAQQTLQLLSTGSQYVSGRLSLPGYEQHVADRFDVVVALKDPYLDLAERLLILKAAANGRTGLLDARDRMIYGPVIAAVGDLRAYDERGLRRILRGLERAAAVELANPLTRQLTTAGPGETCGADAAASALRALSGFAVVALLEIPGHLAQGLGGLIARPLPSRLGEADAAPDVAMLAHALTAIPLAEALLEVDLEVYDVVRDAVEAAAPSPDQRR